MKMYFSKISFHRQTNYVNKTLRTKSRSKNKQVDISTHTIFDLGNELQILLYFIWSRVTTLSLAT